MTRGQAMPADRPGFGGLGAVQWPSSTRLAPPGRATWKRRPGGDPTESVQQPAGLFRRLPSRPGRPGEPRHLGECRFQVPRQVLDDLRGPAGVLGGKLAADLPAEADQLPVHRGCRPKLGNADLGLQVGRGPRRSCPGGWIGRSSPEHLDHLRDDHEFPLDEPVEHDVLEARIFRVRLQDHLGDPPGFVVEFFSKRLVELHRVARPEP